LRAIRRSLVVRTLAVCLVVLGIWPFTAPFAVCDLADLSAPSGHSDSFADAKDIKDADTVAVSIVSPDTSLHFLPLLQPWADTLATAFVRALVLRI